MTEKPEKKTRRKLTLADRVAAMDERIKRHEAALQNMLRERHALVEEALRKANAQMEEAKRVGSEYKP